EADATTAPLDVAIDAAIEDLGHRQRPGHVELRLASHGLADRVVFDATVSTPDGKLSCDWTLLLRGLDLRRLAPALFAGIDPLYLAANGQLRVAPPAADATLITTRLGITPHSGIASKLTIGANCTMTKGGRTVVECELEAGRLTLQALRPLLARSGIEVAPEGIDAKVQASLDLAADGAVSMQLRQVAVAHGNDRAEFGRVAIEDLRTDEAGLSVAAITVGHAALHASRFGDDSIGCAGLRLRPVGTAAPAVTTTTTNAPATAAAAERLPAIRIGRLRWHDADLRFTDRSLKDAPTLAIDRLRLDGQDLAFGCEAPPGQLRFSLHPTEVAESIGAEIRVAPKTGGASIEADLATTGLTLRGLAPWLQPAGITPVLESGTLSFGTAFDIDGKGVPDRLTAQLANLRFSDGEEVLLSLRHAELNGLRLRGVGPMFVDARIDEPYLLIERGAESTTLLGLRFDAAAPSAPVATPGDANPDTGLAPGAESSADSAPSAAPETGPVELTGAVLRLRDPADPTRTLALGIDGGVGAIRRGAVVPFDLTLHVEQEIDDLALRGQATLDGPRVEVTTDLIGSGIRGSALRALLPPYISSPLQRGELAGRVHLLATTAAAGTALDLTVDGLSLRDRGIELLALDNLAIHAPRLGAESIHIASVRARGLRGAVTTTADGLLIPGLLIGDPAAATSAPATAPEPATPVAPGRTALPALTIDEILIACDGIVWRDRRRDDAEPLRAGLSLELIEPWSTAPELEDSKPLRLRVGAAATPLLAELQSSLTLQPFATEP
ncbi:MAG: DUF748 domain-containing protein, partial [Planctomycetes bacterium]|nr:DUF748 domain-containing protein [Planctomycetota bacterium]